jgi:hypothetical protein
MSTLGRFFARLKDAMSPPVTTGSGETTDRPSGTTGAPETSTNAQPAGASDEPWPGNDAP